MFLSDERFLYKFFVYLNEHILFDRVVSFKDLSETFDISERSFYRQIKDITGVTPSNFMNVLRFGEAREMVLLEYSIEDIMFKISVDSEAYFYKRFKLYFYKTPNVYKKNRWEIYSKILSEKFPNEELLDNYLFTAKDFKYGFYSLNMNNDVAIIISSKEFQLLLMKSYLEKVYNKLNPLK